MDRYTHSLWEDLNDAVARLPDLSLPDGAKSRATGTDGGGPESVAFCVAQKGAEPRANVRFSAVSDDRGREEGLPEKKPRSSKVLSFPYQIEGPTGPLVNFQVHPDTASDNCRMADWVFPIFKFARPA